ncbi:IclR family transcriptional regulator [Clostridioides difficile]|uniref:IclR family transcriptional regulator n=1 Tax=Clostridioides difficile TaxID=1496 RepID=UPI000C9A0BC7|nr:IclR family transcriptional regulator [Clostridioides difficile]MCM0742317.1 IclR family transcriptional regulator [Clostridioides difficile]MCM0746112.1 IclR family transcriptional regulator [Clostridioides difficile]MCP8337509.1 IclR family transcriptional regulator [Clostridioides difficile]MCP8380836.1 IclR family transcriptional regulator [Clostridioides difficile]MCP8384433.1 IclR family transcriptional regulator [Clostridioides difficile]
MGEIINALDRALEIILLLYHEKREMGITEISKAMGVYKSTVHRTLVTLENKGFVIQNAENGKYWLGINLYAIGMVVGEKMSLTEIVKPYTKKLNQEFNEVVNVSILEERAQDSPRSIIIHKEYGSNQLLSVNPSVGSSSECYCSAVGKCLMAFNDSIDFEKYRKTPIHKYTEHTIDNWDDMMLFLAKIKEQGYAIDDEELEHGLTCIGAPILDKNNKAIAAISLSGPTIRMREGDFEYKIKRVIETAKSISELFR